MFYAAYSDCCNEVGHSSIVKFDTKAEAEAHLDKVCDEYTRFGAVMDEKELADWVASDPFEQT